MRQLLRRATRVVTMMVLTSALPDAPARAQSRDLTQYVHSTWLLRDGPMKTGVTTMAQTPDGYMWFGTPSGIYRFDGVRFVRWQPPGRQLPNGEIRRLAVTRDGALWIVPYEGGLLRWKDGRLTGHASGTGIVLTQIVEATDGTMWFGTVGAKVCQLKGAHVTCEGTGQFGQTVTSIVQDRQGAIWVAAWTGLWRWAPGEPRQYTLPNGARPRTLALDDDGTLLITTDRLWRMVGQTFKEHSLVGIGTNFTPSTETPDRMQLGGRLIRSRDGGLWLSAANKGLLHSHDGKTDRLTVDNGLTHNRILELFEDREGHIWVSTEEGLDRFRTVSAQTFSTRQGLSSSTVWSVQATADGDLWIGTSAGLNRMTAGANIVLDPDVRGPVYALGLDDAGHVLASTPSGLVSNSGGRFARLPGAAPGPVAVLASEHDGTTWMSMINRELVRRSPHGVLEKIAVDDPFASPNHLSIFRALLPDPRGGLWLGAWGVAYLSNGTVTATYQTKPARDEPSFGLATDLRWGSDGAVWASAPIGLVRVKDGQLTHLNRQNGLPCNDTHWSIEDDDHALWLYQSCGLVRIAAAEWHAWLSDPRKILETTILGPEDGVRRRGSAGDIGPIVTKAADGRLWFVVPGGIGVVDPRNLRLEGPPPHVGIEQISADGKSYDVTEARAGRVRLAPSLRNLAIDFTTPSFTAPDKVRFRFKLDGQDPDWREVGNQRRATYSNLSPGFYRFHVTAANGNSAWSRNEAVLEFDVLPALHQTAWFRALLMAGVVGLFFAGHRGRVRQLAGRERRSRESLERIPAMAFTALPDGANTFVNSRWAEYTGLGVADATGSRWQGAVHPDDLGRVLDTWRAAQTAGEPIEYEVRLRDRGGAYRWFLVRAIALRDKRGQIVRWYGVATDIEDRRRTREALDRARADLSHVARVTTLGALTASIAHEVNQPLSGIVTNASACLRMLAGDEPNIEGARETARRTIRDGNRASDVVGRLRALFSRRELSAEPIDFSDTVREVLSLVTGELQSHKVVVRQQLADRLPPITGDRVQLQQVIVNLLMNAAQAMSDVTDRSRDLDITTEVAGGNVRLLVKDAGVGIDPVALARLFEPFYTTKPNGMGIGLSVCRSIIERHGGRLSADPHVDGPGVTFVVSIPFAADASVSP